MASGDPSNQVPIIQGGNSIIGGMPVPLPDSQQRHWIPDDRDNFISWLRGEFAAANAIIDSLCHHLQMIGKPGEYDFVLTCIQQRRYNWTVVLHMQQYFSVAEVVFALQQVVWMKQAMNSDPSGLPPLFVSPENGGGPPWKEDIYRDPRGEAHVLGGLHHNSLPEGQLHGRKEAMEMPLKSDEPGARRRSYSGDQERQHHPTVTPSVPDSSPHLNRNQLDLAEQGIARVATGGDISFSEASTASIPVSSQARTEPKEQKESSDQGSNEQGDWEGSSPRKMEAPEVSPAERAPTPHFHISSKEEDDQRVASIKISKGHSCFEQIDGRMVNTMDGLEIHEKVLDKLEASKLVILIQETRNAAKRGELGAGAFVGPKKGPKGKGREVLQFGHFHHHSFEDHKRRSIPKDDLPPPPVPAYLEAIIDRLIRWNVIPSSKKPDCCSINIMEEGDYLPPHLDTYLERPYCTLAVQSEIALVMGHSLTTSGPGDFKGPFQLSLPVGSVLILQKHSADLARHSISASPSKRIYITLGKSLPPRSQKGHNTPTSGISQSPPPTASVPSSNSWGQSFNHGSNNRQGNNSNLHHNTSARSGGGGYAGPFKTHKYAQVSSSSTSSSSGGVLPNPTPRPPTPAQIISNVPNSAPPLFSATPGPSPPAGAFPPPSLPIPTWSPLPRPPPPSRLPSAGTGVFFPSGGAASGPGRPANVSTPRRSGNMSSSAPPLLQKTNSAPASFASLETAALAATTAPSTPPGKLSKPNASTNTPESVGKVAQHVAPLALSPPAENLNVPSRKTPTPSDHQYETNGAKSGKEDNPAPRSSGRSSKASTSGNISRTPSTGGTVVDEKLTRQ